MRGIGGLCDVAKGRFPELHVFARTKMVKNTFFFLISGESVDSPETHVHTDNVNFQIKSNRILFTSFMRKMQPKVLVK